MAVRKVFDSKTPNGYPVTAITELIALLEALAAKNAGLSNLLTREKITPSGLAAELTALATKADESGTTSIEECVALEEFRQWLASVVTFQALLDSGCY